MYTCTSYVYMYLICIYMYVLPLYKMGPTLQQSYGLAMLQALILPTSFCHPLHSRVPILMWPSYKSHIDFHWPSGVRISLHPTFLDNSPICTIVLSLTRYLISQTSAIMSVIVYVHVHMHCLFISETLYVYMYLICIYVPYMYTCTSYVYMYLICIHVPHMYICTLYAYMYLICIHVPYMYICTLGQTNLITWCLDFFRKIKERPTEIKIKM